MHLHHLTFALFLLALPLPAQTPPPTYGLLRGHLIEILPPDNHFSPPLSTLILRATDRNTYHIDFNTKTYIEWRSRSASPDQLRPGDFLEIIADHGFRPRIPYARLIRILDPPGSQPSPLERYRSLSRTTRRPYDYRTREDLPPLPYYYRSPTESFLPRGQTTLSGIVLTIDLSAYRLTLRQRNGQKLTLLLRPDTRYVFNGGLVNPKTLRPGQLVFLRANPTLSGQLEVFQIYWGRILQP